MEFLLHPNGQGTQGTYFGFQAIPKVFCSRVSSMSMNTEGAYVFCVLGIYFTLRGYMASRVKSTWRSMRYAVCGLPRVIYSRLVVLRRADEQ